jgi:hypothetical protein
MISHAAPRGRSDQRIDGARPDGNAALPAPRNTVSISTSPARGRLGFQWGSSIFHGAPFTQAPGNR